MTPAPENGRVLLSEEGLHIHTHHLGKKRRKAMKRRNHDLQRFEDVLGSSLGPLVLNPPDWVKRGIGRRLGNGSLVVVSAVCPDYEVKGGRFTYRKLNEGVPFIAREHLEVAANVGKRLAENGIDFQYSMTLADTEFDLPLVVKALSDGDSAEFLRRCEASCEALKRRATELGIRLLDCKRFTAAFPSWFEIYGKALEYMKRVVTTDESSAFDLDSLSANRMPLYRAMAGGAADAEYCRAMVLRQWAQYATWGECATREFGNNLVMMNHSTPNLSCMNSPVFRNNRERIPILQLGISTMPD